MRRRLPFQRHRLLYGFAFGTILSLLFLGLSVLLPSLITSNYYGKSLKALRKQTESIRKEFADLEKGLQLRQKALLGSGFPRERSQIFELFKKTTLNPEIEGVAYYDEYGELAVWLGNVIDFKPASTDLAVPVRNKASFYLISAQRIRQSESVIFFRLLSFVPELKAPFLADYHFLNRDLRRNCIITYWDYRQDVLEFEKMFSRHNDEYIGQPRLQNEIQTIFFPLRNAQKKIVATVNLSSPSLLSSQSRLRENMILLFILVFGASLLLIVSHLARSLLSSPRKKFSAVLLLIIPLIALRLVFFPLSRLERIQALPLFSPALASFLTIDGLTQSPVDIFLTSLFLFLIVGSLAIAGLDTLKKIGARISSFVAVPVNIVLISASCFAFLGFQKILSRLVLNSDINLLRFAADIPFLLLHLSLLFLFLGAAVLSYFAFRAAQWILPQQFGSLFLFVVVVFAFPVFLGQWKNPVVPILQTAALALLFLLARRPAFFKKKEVLFGALILATAFNYSLLHHESSFRLHSLIQDFLHDTIIAQENWADFLIRQSIPEIEKRNKAVLDFLRSPGPSPLARSLWENTLVAKFNWYSTLEVLNPEGEILSRFSLNIPQLFRPEMTLPLSQTWSVSRRSILFLGKEKEFILGYKDWFSQGQYLGRINFYLTIDPEMLPFLYSANPYFELLKMSSLPSLHQQQFGFAIYDLNGKLVFNPDKISAGITPDTLRRLQESPDSTWTSFRDKKKNFAAFCFSLNNRIYSLFFPQKNFQGFSVEFLKLFFFYAALSFLVLLFLPSLFQKKKMKNIFWSFSSRVYAAFIAITVIALFLFSLFSQRFFNGIFTQGFVEKAEIHANFARNIMQDYQDFVLLQQDEKASPMPPPDDLVLWIGSAIANDVNLYKEGRLISSSRREFFDWGLLPELIDGEIDYRIRAENMPFYTQRQKIGSYSFYSLTIPYTISQSHYLISLPFPFEKQEITKATGDLVEFLVFISVFFIALVLLLARGMGAMIISPVRKLLAGTKEVSLGNLEISIEHASHDEMKTLIDGFNSMIKNLKKHQQEIAELSKKAAWAEMAQKVAHEIKNPLTPIQLSAEHLLRVYEDRRGDFDRALKESMSYIIGEVDNLRKIAQEFLELSRDTSLKKEPFDLKEAIEEVISPYKKMLSERIKFRELHEGKDFQVEADKSKIKIAVRNIFINAIEAIRGKGSIELRLSAEEGYFLLVIKDTGIGMARDLLEKIFDPYFSTKDVGTGLGLPIAKKIIEDHGGSIRAESEVNKGTTITITLPC
jgi:signal transduction histidine kinase